MSAEGRAFVDTDVLVYAYDETAGTKRDEARSLVQELFVTLAPMPATSSQPSGSTDATGSRSGTR